MLWDNEYPFCRFENDISYKEMYVIEDETRIIGSFALNNYDNPDYHSIQWTSKNKKWLYLSRLAILPSEQGKGYAKQTIKFIEMNNNYEVIRLTVYEDNENAIGLYEKLGFSKIENGYWQLEDKIYNGYEKYIN